MKQVGIHATWETEILCTKGDNFNRAVHVLNGVKLSREWNQKT